MWSKIKLKKINAAFATVARAMNIELIEL